MRGNEQRLHSTSTVQVLLSQVSMQLPVYASGSGKVLLAYQEWSEARTLIEKQGFMPLTPNTITTPDVLLHELKQIHRQGYAYDREEVLAGLCAIGYDLTTLS